MGNFYRFLHFGRNDKRERARRDSSSRALFAFVRLHGSGFDSENRLAFLHKVEPIARDRLQINGIGLKQIDFARLFGEQRLLFVALGLKLIDIIMAELQFLVGRNEKAHNHQPHREQKQNQEDTVPTLPNGSFTPHAEICVIHSQRILPP